MFVRLTRSKRAKAGWLVALLYLLCVLAPGAALALGDAASCLPMTVRATAEKHDHAHALHAADHTDAHAGHGTAGETRHQHHDKTSPGPCCAMLCVSAIASDLPGIARPVQPKSIQVSDNFQRLPGKAPPLLYRPPIA
jgi:ABC-type Zn2+ transport system substrate-binding protein/surface adhesin